ncbi:sensor histidine kinase [Stenotrophomonas sp. NRRL B-14846]|uniref:sensor histidine kinase n=1 Tax=Stenotrophomonas sp. NRRL B-14846 TaxID=3162882 RepID=UPI003D2E1394
MQASPPRRWLLLAPLLIALPLLWLAMRHLRARGDRSGAHAIGVISHEMRNSAQAVLTSIELLGQSTLPKGERDLLAAASTASQSLRSLLNRALDFSRLASGAFKPHAQACDAVQLCRQALEAIRPQAQRKGLQLHLDTQDASPSNILVDADALRQIASNLLANAVKFSDIGGIELRLQLMPTACPRELLLEVIDSGIGIAPAQVATPVPAFPARQQRTAAWRQWPGAFHRARAGPRDGRRPHRAQRAGPRQSLHPAPAGAPGWRR